MILFRSNLGNFLHIKMEMSEVKRLSDVVYLIPGLNPSV